MARSTEAKKVLRELEKELESASKRVGQNVVWSASEQTVLGLISGQIDRKCDLFAAYEESSDAKVRVKLSTEMRLLEQSIARLLKLIKTDLPAPASKRTVRARRADQDKLDGTVMPRVSDSGGARFRVPGCYEKLLAGGCRCFRDRVPCRSDIRLDPRIRSSMADPLTEEIALFDWLRAQCAWEAGQDRAERLAAGEPFEVPRYRFGGHSIPRDDGWPAWLLDHFEGVRSVRVYADDTVAPWSEHPCHPPPAYTTYGPFLKA